MKTSKILLAMALPVAFAACTSEEIVENSNNLNMQNRKVIPAITAYVESGVDSRFSWNEEKFSWNEFTAEDKFAAGLTDAELWTVGDKMMTNYIYSTTGNGYETTSQMVEGTYFFYSYPGFENVAARQAVPFDLTSQKSVDFKNPTAAVEANQLFVSALYKLDAETANDPIKIGFMSYWSTVGLKIKNTTGDDIKVLRMMIETTTAAGKESNMALRGELSPKALGSAAEKNAEITGFVYYKDGDSYVLPYKDADDKTKGRVSISDMRTKVMANTDVKNGLSENTMMLVVENGELADDEEATVYFQMPAGTHANVKATFFVEVPTIDDETEVKMLEAVPFVKNAKSATTVEENDVTELRRHNTIAAFGQEGGKLVAHEITELDVLSALEAGAYAASYEDLVDIIKAGAEKKISNMGDLKIDDAVIKLLNSTTAINNGPYEFANEIEITSEKSSDVTLNNFSVSGGATIVKGKFVVKSDMKGDLTVEQGAKLTVSASQTGTITNLGTVVVSSLNPIKVTIKDGATKENEAVTSVTVNVKGEVNVGEPASTLFNATESWITFKTLPNKLYFSAPVVESVAQAVTVYGHKFTIANGKKVYVGSDVTLQNTGAPSTAGVIINGYLENKGTLKSASIYGAWDATNKKALGASVENHGTIENLVFGSKISAAKYPSSATPAQVDACDAISDAVNAAVTVTNMKKEAKIVNPTKVVADMGAQEYVSGRIDNNQGGFVTSNTNNLEVFADIVADQNGKVNISGINTLYLKDLTWTDAEVSGNIEYIHMDGVTLNSTEANANKKVAKTLLTEATEVYFKDGVANQHYTLDTNFKDVDGSIFNYGLTYGASELTGVTVKGLYTNNTATTLTLTGVTFDKFQSNSITKIEVNGTEVLNADHSVHSYIVETTTFGDSMTTDGTTELSLTNGLIINHDAVLNVLNDVEINVTGLTINGATTAGSDGKSSKGVLNQYGTINTSGTTTENGVWNK